MSKSVNPEATEPTADDLLNASVSSLMGDMERLELVPKTTMRRFRTEQASERTPKVELTPPEIKLLRTVANVSQAVFAEHIGVSQRAVEQWESGLKKPMGSSAKMLALIAKHGLKHVA